MKRTNGIAILACILIAVAACKKENNNDQVKENLTGKWKATTNALDDNGNGIMDAGETFPDGIYLTHNLVFTSDGVLTIVNGTIIAGKKNWELAHGNTYLHTFESTSSTYYHIDALTSSSFTLKDTTGGHITWITFAKL